MSYGLPEELEVRCEGPVRVVRLNRPEKLNSINRALHRAMAAVWRQLAADPEARVVVLTGAGRAFCAGGDIEWITTFGDNPAAGRESLREAAEIIDEMLRFRLPIIAAVNGPAVGLGCSVAILCDIVLIAEDAHLADPHVAIGLAAGDGGAAFWPLLTNIMRTREQLFTGERISAPQAVELGLASRTVPADELESEAMRLAERLARRPAFALQETKRVINMYLSQALAGPVSAGLAAEGATMQTVEHRDKLARLRAAES